jgi:cytochrome c553
MMRAFLLALLALPVWGVAAPADDAAKGATLAAKVCAACHGADGNSPLSMNPNLAGQHAEYLNKQLRDFKSGKRSNPVMAPIAASLSDDDMRNLSAHYAAQKASVLTAKDLALATKGQKLFRAGVADKGVAACAGCHSPNGAGIPIQYPRVAGQHADYVAAQLKAFRAEERGNDENNVMRSIAARLSDREIAALSEYLAGLR